MNSLLKNARKNSKLELKLKFPYLTVWFSIRSYFTGFRI